MNGREALCSFDAPIGKAALREDVEVAVLVLEKASAEIIQLLQDFGVNLFVRPFALGKNRIVAILLGDEVDFNLGLVQAIISPPTTDGAKEHGKLFLHKLAFQILLADVIKYAFHVIREKRLYAIPNDVAAIVENERGIWIKNFEPKSVHIVRNSINPPRTE